jgi:SAM-dependent methyltransferase
VSGSAIYRNVLLYAALNRGLYGVHWREHYLAVAERICENASVLELCCGTGVLYERFLEGRGVTYLGLDNSEAFVERLRRRGIGVRHFDVWRDSLPANEFDYVIMQASLYQFIPDGKAVVERMLHSARKEVIVSEPIRNHASSRFGWIARVARRISRPPAGAGEYLGRRFDAESLDECMAEFGDRILERAVICGGRDCLYRLAAADPHAAP